MAGVAGAGLARSASRAASEQSLGMLQESGVHSPAVRRPFDPLLDPACRVAPAPSGEAWRACWIWHPGQLTAHIHAKRMRAAMSRCTSVGYPSAFRQPLSHAAFRKRATLPGPTVVRWAGPLGRIRVQVNGAEGDITLRATTLPAGPVELVVRIDFAGDVPALILEGEPFSTDGSWESSVDDTRWVPVESVDSLHDPTRLPSADREVTVEIPPRLAWSRGAIAAPRGWNLRPGGELVLDFFHDEIGALAYTLSGAGRIDTQVGESLTEVRDPNPEWFEQAALATVTATSATTPVVLPERCARYVRFRSTGDVRLRDVRFLARVTPVAYRGRFECDDAELNAIWSAGAATMHACLHDFYVDGLRRDALSWDDGALNIEAADTVFDDALAARHSIVSLMLPDHPTVQDLGIIDAPLHVLLGMENDVLVRGDPGWWLRYRDRAAGILDFFLSLQNREGFVDGRQVRPYGFFPDWSATRETGPDPHGTPAYAQMLLMRALEIGAAFGRRWKDEALAGRYADAAARLRAGILQAFWDPAAGAFVNGYDAAGKRDDRFSSFAQVFAILFDLVPREQWPRLFERVLENPACRAPNLSILSFYEHVAYAKAGRMEPVLARLRRAWGGLLRAGYTRFIEDIRPEDSPLAQLRMYGRPYSNSLCHTWAGAAAVILLVRGVLGIWPLEPGYASCLIRPQRSGLGRLAGSVPTPGGPLSLELDAERGGTLVVPRDVTAKLAGCHGPQGERAVSGPATFRLAWD
jgi:alpha-L-rhamnosidase